MDEEMVNELAEGVRGVVDWPGATVSRVLGGFYAAQCTHHGADERTKERLALTKTSAIEWRGSTGRRCSVRRARDHRVRVARLSNCTCEGFVGDVGRERWWKETKNRLSTFSEAHSTASHALARSPKGRIGA